MFKILIVDDDPTLQVLLKRNLQNQGYDVIVASNGADGLREAKQNYPALIICDWMMQEMDGLEVCRQIKSDPDLATTFFILLTAKGNVEDRIQGLDAGADDFLSKPIEMNELKARVRAGLRLNHLYEDLRTQKQAVEALNLKLREELDEAAEYVRSLLPSPLTGTVTTESRFIPSAQLGGDCFDYYWLYDGLLAIYLLDVSGHGVGAALLSIAVLNVLRSQSLPHTNFCQPSDVLKALNHAFQMSNHGEKYFTIWYGVYDQINRQLIYASAGHPPAVLLSKTSEITQVTRLESSGLPIGFWPDADYDDCYLNIEPGSNLYVFSDGAYEIIQPDGSIWGVDAFIRLLTDSHQKNSSNLEPVIQQIQKLNSDRPLDDDFSLIRVNFDR
jgi:phosphoserine phosphatase RsbU/P